MSIQQRAREYTDRDDGSALLYTYILYSKNNNTRRTDEFSAHKENIIIKIIIIIILLSYGDI